MADRKILNEDQDIVNEQRLCADDIAKEMRTKITKLKGKFMSEDGSSVNYKDMGDSAEFESYVKTSRSLTALNLSDLSQSQLKCLFLNMYNSLTVHAMVYQSSQGSPPNSPLQVEGFWKIHCYNVGGSIYSLDDMEHGVLRSNRGHPSSGEPQFGVDDDRSKCIVNLLDPRIHFALNCGARSCPPIRVYTADRLEEQLDIATISFLSQEVRLLPNEGKVELSKLFLWYAKDFGSTDTEVLQWICSVVGDKVTGLREMLSKPVEIVYRQYVWDTNTTK